MSEKLDNLTITVPRSELADPETFEALRLDVYRKEAQDPTELTALVEQTMLKDGSELFDRFEAVLVDDDSSIEAMKKAEERARLVSKAIDGIGVVLYDISIGKSSEVEGIEKRTLLPEDKVATKAQQRMASHVPSGKKQNNSSFRVTRI